MKWQVCFSLVFGLGVLSCDETTPLRLPSVRRCVIEVRYQPPHFPTVLDIEVEGQRAPLQLLDSQLGVGGLWGADVWVSPGWQSYTLRLDGRVLTDPKQSLTFTRSEPTLEQGQTLEQERTLVKVPNCHQGRWFRVSARQGNQSARFELAYQRALNQDQRLEASQGESLPQGVPLDPKTLRVELDGMPHPFALDGELITLEVNGLPPGKYHLVIHAQDQEGISAEQFEAPFWIDAWTDGQPHRWTRGIMYQIVLDRLSPPLDESDEIDQVPSIGERWGGKLTSVSDLILSGYFEELGVTSLWISPLAPNPSGAWTGVEGGEPRYEGYHGYWAIAPRVVGDEWGGEEELRRVVKLAHERGIRVIVDVALNHVHEQHPYVSEHPEWFNPPGCLCGKPGCDWGTYIETCRFTTYLPDFRWRGTDAMFQQVADAMWWVEEFDLDGLRVDAVPMMPRQVTRLLSVEMRRRFEGLRTRHLLIGETFTGPREWERIGWYLGPDGLDGQFDFPWMWALREVIAWEREPMWSLLEIWRSGEATWSQAGALMGLFVGNHDVTRFASEATGDDLGDPWQRPPPQTTDKQALDRLWIATSLTFTLPGIPVLYYGDEVGLSGANDPDNRRPFWPLGVDDPAILQTTQTTRATHYQRVAKLGRLRKCLSALSEPESKVTFLATDSERLSFMRGALGQEVVVVIQRKGNLEPSILSLPTPSQDELWIDALSGEMLNEEVSVSSPLFTQIHLPPLPDYSVRVLVRNHQSTHCLEF